MPGVIMDQNTACGQDPGLRDNVNSNQFNQMNSSHSGNAVELKNGLLHTNGFRNVEQYSDTETAETTTASPTAKNPPELQHITEGFFPLSKLVNRSVQQCWNDLADLVAELAGIEIPSQASNTSSMGNGKVSGNQSPEIVRKRLRALEFTQARREEFIKLLVLSQWSRQASDVSRLIDIQNYIRTQHQAYAAALQWVGDMKRGLVRAQVANPDLRTALEVLSKGEVVSMPDVSFDLEIIHGDVLTFYQLGYKPPKTLTPKSTLRKLRKINRVISARLALHENVPLPFQTYRIHNGRVTFLVPGEFELDLSIGEEDATSQLFFVDIRFTFKPSPSVPAGRLFSELDLKVNDILQNSGLPGCYDWLHSLVLTNKINILAKQALNLTRNLWANVLRIELLHRTLVLQYWSSKPGAKSWLEIGIRHGLPPNNADGQHSPALGLRWIRDGQEVNSESIDFDTENLSVEYLLRSVTALHISHILSSVFRIIGQKLLYSNGSLSLQGRLTKTEPGHCQLDVQLTASRQLRVGIDPMSGVTILAATPNTLERVDTDRNTERPIIDDIVSRVTQLRCAAAIEEIESQVKMFGFESVSPRNVKIDARKVFPANVLRFSFFWHRLWDHTCILAATSGMDGDNWWVVQTRFADPTTVNRSFDAIVHANSIICSAQVICNTLFPAQQTGHSPLADLGHCLSGFLAIYANGRFLEELQFAKILPPLKRLKIGYALQVPDLSIEYEATKLPQALQIALPPGFKKKAFVKNTLRLTFHGVDRHRNVAVMVAYGKLSTSFQNLSDLIPKDDHSLVFQKAGSGFALRLIASPGYPVILTLLESLQKLECVLSIYDLLRLKKMDTRSLSLSCIGFAYGPDRDLFAQLDIGESKPQLSTETDPAKLASRTDPLFYLRLGIKFDYSNPHRRIQGALASNLNRPTTDAGLDTFAELLSFTLPLMRALNRLLANATHNEPLKVHVTVRSTKAFQINYPLERCQFKITAHQHQNQPVWVLKDLSNTQNGSGENPFKYKLQESLYNSKGLGWRGLGNGAVAKPDAVGNLLDELDKCLAAIRAELTSKPLDSKPNPNNMINNELQNTVLTKPAEASTDPCEGTGNRNKQQKIGAGQKANIIMID